MPRTIYFNNKKTEYKYVRSYSVDKKKLDELLFYASITKFKRSKGQFKTAKEAAIQVDTWLIQAGKEPVNVLKRK